MSTAEKLAWAKRNGVTPPKYLVAEVEGKENEPRSCCSHESAPPKSACSAVAKRSCCSADEGDDSLKKQSRSHAPAQASKQFVWVHGIQAQQCQGLATMWVLAGAVLAPPPLVLAPVDIAPPVWLTLARISRWKSLSSPPDVPPPRCA